MIITNWDVTSGGVPGVFDSGVCVKSCPTEDDPTIECKEGDIACPADLAAVYLDKGSYDLLGLCLPKDPGDVKDTFELIKNQLMGSGVGPYLNDLYRSSRSIFLSLAMSVVYSILFIYFLSAFGETIAWICVVVLQLFLFAVAGLGWYFWDQTIKNGANLEKKYPNPE